MGKIISRPLYIKRIQGFIGKNLIKVIVGQRRVGKSFILKQLIRSIEEDTADANIIYIDKELNQFNNISDHQELYNYVKQQYQSKKKNFLFIDEVQEIKAFEKGLRNLHAEENIDIYCTGSNANLLSGELATLLSGRYIEFRISPLSYPEFL
ncbi:MAG: ATPase, partial [Bacteroidetes bacterium]|nr:ATPase [Bacteroidota bacterium]